MYSSPRCSTKRGDEMKRVIRYTYYSWGMGCGCCSDSASTYDMWEDGRLVEEDQWCEWCSNEEELREVLAHLEPFEVAEDCEWF